MVADGFDLPALRERDRATTAVVGVTALALLARLVLLGGRVAHYDEARVAWWTLHFAETGEIHYRFIIHGTFIRYLNRYLFAVLGPSDFTMRLVPALVGGLLPLAALLFRERLRDAEVVALAVFLAANPVLVYYSRFSRSTILVAGFMFVAFGLFVRALDARDARYAHAGVVFVAFAFAAKENAVVYLLVWLGAGVLLLDHRLFSPLSGESGLDRLRAFRADNAARLRANAPAYAGHLALGAVLFAAVFVFFHAPRAGAGGGVGLWQGLTDPGRLPAVFDAMVGDLVEGYGYWFGGASDPGCNKDNVIDGYLCYLGRFIEVLARYAAPLFGLAVVGALAERYAADRPRDLVMFASYWGFVSVLGYPLGTDIWGAWVTVNALVPLAVPAAVGLALVYRWGREAFIDEDRVGVGLAAVLLLLVAGQVAVAGVNGVYRNPTAADNQLVQYAQPAGEMRETTRTLEAVAPANDGPDVLVYGDYYVDGAQEATRTPACVKWFKALPMPWYFALSDADVVCAANETQLDDRGEMPPVVISRAENRAELAGRLDGYSVRTFRLRTTAIDTVVFVDEDRVPS